MNEPQEEGAQAHQHDRDLKDIARRIADDLGEKWGPPRRQIWRIVMAIGPARALSLLAEAQAIQAQGGEQTASGKRQRSPGGTFFKLVRRLGAENETIRRMFMAHPPKHGGHSEITSMSPMNREATWEDRLGGLEDMVALPGEAKTMKVTLTGRPGKVIDKGTYVMTSMPAQKQPALPKGLPVLPDGALPPQTLVMIAKKQWRRVEGALEDPQDILVIEGIAVYEEAVKGLAVLATTVTTGGLQRAKRQIQDAAKEHL